MTGSGISQAAHLPFPGQVAHQGRGAADCGEYRQAAGPITEGVKREAGEDRCRTGKPPSQPASRIAIK
jgi:hypothetical protein